MRHSWTFGQKIGFGFAAMVVFVILIGVVSIYALRAVIREKDRVIAVHAQSVIGAEKLLTRLERGMALNRGFLLTQEAQFLEERAAVLEEFSALVRQLRSQVSGAEETTRLDKIEQAFAFQLAAIDRVIEMRKTGADAEASAKAFKEEVVPKVQAVEKLIVAFVDLEQRLLEDAKRAATASASVAITAVIGIALVGLLLAAGLAFFLSRLLGRQIGSAVQHIQSSSTELQAAANQQTTGSQEQVASMSEISTTIRELVATARQIAESAQRVAHIAEDTASAARAGDITVQTAQEVIAGIKRQVDLIVTHMLDLGQKSQQIGGILEIINELAEQTNILAINATIEAAGAGEVGKRFGVVADEVRKLADRVGGSTKETRTLIEEIRAAVNTTVMATESGAKAVDAGARQFGEVTAAFQQIGSLVGTTTEAAREIELSTKQQTTAVEQVNIAIANIAQAARESEASSTQTLQTASELTALSRELARLVQSQNQV